MITSTPEAFDVAILCALPRPELEKVLSTGNVGWQLQSAAKGDPTSYYETTYTTAKGNPLRVVAAATTQMGMPASAVLATKVILRFRPRLVAMVGIAAGAKSDAQGYGDILVPNRTFDYNAGKLSLLNHTLRFEPDPDPLRVSERVRTRVDHWRAQRIGLDEINRRWPAAKPRTRLEIHVGPLGSGAAVLDARQPVLEVLEHWRKLIGIEMEAYGVHLACQNAMSPSPEFLCMKSICDFAAEKTDSWQEYAAFTAAELCSQFLREEWENIFPAPRATSGILLTEDLNLDEGPLNAMRPAEKRVDFPTSKPNPALLEALLFEGKSLFELSGQELKYAYFQWRDHAATALKQDWSYTLKIHEPDEKWISRQREPRTDEEVLELTSKAIGLIRGLYSRQV